MRRTTPFLAALAVLAGSFAATALAGIDVGLPPKARVLGTILPEGEVETFSFDATRGTELTVTVTAKRGTTLDPSLLLDGPEGLVALSGAPRFTDEGRKIVVKKLELDATGTYVLELSGTGTGQYTLAFAATPRRVWRETGLDIAALESAIVEFAAPADSRINFSAKRSRGSAAEPRFGKFDGESLADLGRARTSSHVVKKIPAGEGGDLSVVVQNLAAAAGPVNVTVTVAAARSRRQKIDVRAAKLGAPDGGETAIIQRVAAESGGTAVVDDEDDLDGTQVVILPGALAADTPILITSAPDLPPPSGDQQQAGPAATFGPAGTTFSTPALVTLLYDVSKLPVGTDIMNDVKVLRVAGKKKTVLDVVSVDEVEETLTVETDGFSTFMPIVPKGPPQLAGRQYWNIFLECAYEKGYSPRDGNCDFGRPYNDSRRRRASVGLGDLSFDHAKAYFSIDESELELDHHSYPPGESFEQMCFTLFGEGRDISEMARLSGERTIRTRGETETADWRYESDGQTVTTFFGPNDEIAFTVAEDGSVLAGASWGEDSGEAFFALDLAIEKALPPPNEASAQGRYFIVELALGARPAGENPLSLFLERGLGTIDLRPAGTFKEVSDFAVVETDPNANPVPVSVEKDPVRGVGAWSIDGAGALLLTFDPDDDPETVRLFAGVGGDIWVGHAGGDELLMVLLIRQSQNMSPSKLLGDWVLHGIEAEVMQYGVEYYADFPDEPGRDRQFLSLIAPDWRVGAFRAHEEFLVRRHVDLGSETGMEVFRVSNEVQGGLDLDTFSESGGRLTWTVKGNGALHVTDEGDKFDGFVAPNRLFSITMDRVKVERASQLEPFFGFDVRVKPPPRKP